LNAHRYLPTCEFRALLDGIDRIRERVYAALFYALAIFVGAAILGHAICG